MPPFFPGANSGALSSKNSYFWLRYGTASGREDSAQTLEIIGFAVLGLIRLKA
jgi:hypothetical protein